MSLIVASQIGSDFDRLAASHAAVAKLIPLDIERFEPEVWAAEADALIIRPAPIWKQHRLHDRPSGWPGRIRWIQTTSAGIDYFPEWLAEVPWLSCGRGVTSEQVADYVIAALYAHAKNLDGLAIRSADDWKPVVQGSVAGRRVAILGLGSSGLAVARRVQALGAEAIGVRRSPSGESRDADIALAPDIAAAVADANDVVVALPLTITTRGLIDRQILGKMRRGAHLINIARGGIVNQDDLLGALDDGQLGFATLDVTEPEPLPAGHPLYTHPRVRLTPHISSNWSSIVPILHDKIIANLEAVARDLPPQDLVEPGRGY